MLHSSSSWVDQIRALADESSGVPICSEKSRNLALELVLKGEVSKDRTFFSPGHFTSSGFVYSVDLDSILLVWHQKLEKWIQPGGHLESDDDSPICAAIREIWEECGIEISAEHGKLIGFGIHEIPRCGGEPLHIHCDVQFLFSIPKVTRFRDFPDCVFKWFRIDDLVKGHVDRDVSCVARYLRHQMKSVAY
jgi:8-oxo-dGTP pyrophosphatase MutT (NUDIX family)